MNFSQACPDGPLTAVCLDYLGISGSSVSLTVLSSFGLVFGFFMLGYMYGLAVKAIERA